MKFSVFFPNLRGWVQHLDKVWPAYIVKPNFAYWEVLHILSLVMLGGAAIILGLRLIGVGLTEERPSDTWKNLKLWLNIGVGGVVVSGVLIGMANAERLYDSAAFTVKMLSLLAGIILTYGAMRPIAQAEGAVSRAALGWTVAGLAVWALGIFVFLTGGLITPGLFHIITAASLIVLFVLRGRLRWIYVGGVAVIALMFWSATHVFIPTDDLKHTDPVNVGLAWLLAVWIVGCALTQLYLNRKAEPLNGLLPKLVGYAVILVWICGAAAGRWIAFA